jgi:capsular polysaccharide transport system permease protein
MNTRASQASKRNPVGWPGSRAVVDAADAKTGDRDWASPLRGRLIAFVVAVALPTICAALYLQFFAPVEYLAETRFAVRGASEGLPGSDRIGGSLGQLIALNDSQEAHIVAAYINSLAIVADVGKADNLGVLFGAKAVDGDRPITAEAAPERALAFWRRHVDADVDVISGVTTLRVRAFAPGLAIALSNSILKAS